MERMVIIHTSPPSAILAGRGLVRGHSMRSKGSGAGGKFKNQGSHPHVLRFITTTLQELQPVAGLDPGRSLKGGVNYLLVFLLRATFVGYCSISSPLYARRL